jgi:hypothetical protein
MKLVFCISALSLVAGTSSSQASNICKAIALRDVRAIESPKSIIKRGQYDGSITQYVVDKKTGETSFCSHGGYCYPTHVIENGKKLEALRLTNCKVGNRSSSGNPDGSIYDLEPIRSKIPPIELKIADVTDRLIQIGLCSACASNAASLYVTEPASRCAQFTKKALEGDPIATKTLTADFFSYCPTGTRR